MSVMTLAGVRLPANLLLTGGYSFCFESWPDPRPVAHPGQTVLFVGRVRNNGLRLGTVYPVVRVASTYDRARHLFDSDRDLTGNARRALRTVDVPMRATADFAITWNLSDSFEPGVYDCEYELWTPRKLFRKVWAIRLARKVRRGCLEVGDDIRDTLEAEIRSVDAVIVVASSAYVARADRGIGGVGLETSILADPSRFSTIHHKIIPLVRDNSLPSHARLPQYLAGTWYLDMDEDRDHWKGQPLSQVIQRIRRLSDRAPQNT